MIRRKTVLVLGAGASKPYGFPLGTGLRDAIRSLHKMRDDNDRLPLYDKCGASLTDLRDLGREFLYSGVKSIDAFLEKHPSLVDTGKLVIAHEICESEKPKDLIGQADDNWYEYLWHYMHSDIGQADHVRTNHIRFLTFNYDRSLEFFLYNAIKNTFRVPADAALGASQGIKILHVYGTVGDFHHTDSATARAYSPDLNMAKLRLAADGIKIIPNARKDDAVFEEARDWFNWADHICFLGFGFDRTNCERLGLEDVYKWKQTRQQPTPLIFASVLNLTDADVLAARAITCASSTNWITRNLSSLLTLRSTPLFRE